MTRKALYYLSFIYLALPTWIFLIGWTQPYIGIPLSVMSMLVIIHAFIKTDKRSWNKIIINYRDHRLYFLFLIILFWVIFSGTGGGLATPMGPHV